MGSKYGVKRRVCLNLLKFAQKSNIVFARYLQERKHRKYRIYPILTHRCKYAGSTHSQQLSLDSTYE